MNLVNLSVMKSEEEIIESLILGGIIGATLGALITKDKSGTGLGAIAGAALFASFKANEKAKQLQFPLVVLENGTVYKLDKDGLKEMVKHIEKPSIKIPSNFTLN